MVIQQGQNLTARQALMWVGEQLEQDVNASHMLMTFELHGQTEPQRFSKAFQTMLDNTDILRTTFHEQLDGIAIQKVFEKVTANHEYVNFSSEKNANELAQQWINEHANAPLNIECCCYDSALLKISSNAQVSYADYLLDIDKYHSSPSWKRDKEYWYSKLAEAVEPLSVYGRPRNFLSKTRRYSLEIGHERAASSKGMAEGVSSLNQNIAMFLAFTSVLYASLYRITGNKRIGLGAPMHNRTNKFKSTAGLMMDICPLLIEFDDDETFHTLIDKVRNDVFDTMRHSRYTTQNPSYVRVYDVSLNFLNPVFPDFAELSTDANYQTGPHFEK